MERKERSGGIFLLLVFFLRSLECEGRVTVWIGEGFSDGYGMVWLS